MRVMVVDDHPMWRDSVSRDLGEAGFEVVAATGEGAQAVRIAASVRPDVVVLDLQLPDISGVDVTRGILATYPSRQGADPVRERRASRRARRRQGRRDRLHPEVGEPRRVPRRGAADGCRRCRVLPGLAGLVLGEFRRLASDPAPDTPRLTDREAEILRMVGTGMSYKQIAERLFLSHRTVQNHVQNTLNKLHLHNRVDLVRYAIEHGLDTGPEVRPSTGVAASVRV